MKRKTATADFVSERLCFPVNVSPAEEKLFHPFLQWQVSVPKTQRHWLLFVFQNGLSATTACKTVRGLDPADEYHSRLNSFFFIGRLLKIFRSGSVAFCFKPVSYCLNSYSNNYFHWFTEVLPRMLYARESNTNTYFFIPFALKEYQAVSLAIFNIRYRQSRRAVTCCLNVKTIGKFAAMGCYHSGYLKKIREEILALSVQAEKTRRIYVTRQHANRRHIINEEQVHQRMQAHGYEILDFDNMDFRSQVEACRSASVLVSLHGAALTNMIFMQPGSAVLEFVPKNEQNDKCYFTLSGTMQLLYYYLPCDIDGESYVFADYIVDTEKLDFVLGQISSKRCGE